VIITESDLSELGVPASKGIIGRSWAQVALTQPWLLKKAYFTPIKSRRLWSLKQRARELVLLGDHLATLLCHRCRSLTNPGYLVYYGRLDVDFSLVEAVYCFNCAKLRANLENVGILPLQIRSAWQTPYKADQRRIIKLIRNLIGLTDPITKEKASEFFQSISRSTKSQLTLF